MRHREGLFETIISRSSDGVVIIGQDGRIQFANPVAETMLGSKHPLVGEVFAFPIPESGNLHSPLVRELEMDRLNGGGLKGQPGYWIEVTFVEVDLDDKAVFLATLREISERKQAEKMQAAQYQISQAANTADNLDDLFRSVHGVMGSLMPADNFFISLYDGEQDLISFPYFVDEYDTPPPPRKPRRGLTEYVLRTGKPLLAPEEAFNQLVADEEVVSIGAPSLDWLGVPLTMDGGTIGVMVVQTYSESVRLGVKELNFMIYVSEQVAMAIRRKQAQQALRDNAQKLRLSEERYRGYFELPLVGIAITSPDKKWIEVNNKLCELLGYSREELLHLTWEQLTPPEDLPVELAAYQVVLDGKKDGNLMVEKRYIRKDGRIIDVEISASAVRKADGTLDYLMALIHDVTERKSHDRELQAVSSLSALLRTVTNHTEMIPVILEQITNLLQIQAAALMMVDPISAELVVESGSGLWSDYAGMRLGINRGVNAEVLKNKTLFVTQSIRSEESLKIPPGIRDMGNCAAVCAPLLVKEQPVGVLWVARLIPFTEHETHLLSAIADIAASAINRSILHEQTEQRLQHLNSLRRVDLAITSSHNLEKTLDVLIDQVLKQLKVDAATVLLLDGENQILKYAAGRGFHSETVKKQEIRLGEGYAGRAVAEQRTISVPYIPRDGGKISRDLMREEEGFMTYHGTPLVAEGNVKGVLEVFNRSPLKVSGEWIEFLEMLAGQAAIAIDSASLFKNLNTANFDLMIAYKETIEGWAKALELRDMETEGHCQRVTDLTLALGVKMGVKGENLVQLHYGALLHDIGKMGIPDNILQKPGPLTPEEFDNMKRHPQLAYDMLSEIQFLQPALDIPYCHHEHWDGKGYPRGLKGDEIPLQARIFTIVDVWDALRSNRTYRSAWSAQEVVTYIQEQSGQLFDPYVVEVFLKTIHQSESF